MSFSDLTSTPPLPPPSLRPPPPAEDDRALRLLLPVGRSMFAIVAGYAGLFAVVLPMAPVALGLGIAAMYHLKRHPEQRGRGRAVFAIVMGSLFTVLLIVVVVAALAR